MSLKQKRVKFGKYMGLGWACAAVAFLFNPDIALVDVLPDFIGYIFLCLSLLHMRDLSPHFESAFKKFRLLACLAVLKFASLFWVFGVLTNAKEQPTMMLLLSFCFSLGELILGIPAWRELIEGYVLQSQTSGGEFPLREKGARAGREGRSISTSFSDLTVFFICAKAFLANISEFAVLSEHSYDDTAFNWYRFIGLFRSAALIIGISVGIIWLVSAVRYFRGMICDRKFIESAKEKYEKTVLPNTGLFISRDIAFTLGLFCVATLTAADIYIDFVNFVPDTLTAILLLWTFVKMKPYFGKYKLGIAVSALYGAVSIWGASVSYGFISDPIDVSRTWLNAKLFAEFWRMYPVRIFEALMFGATMILALMGVRAMIKGHCGYIPTTMNEGYRSSRLEAIQKEVGGKVTLCLVFAILAMLTGGLYELILSFDVLISELWWMINLAASAILCVSAVYMMSAVCEEVESRYMLD